MPVTFNDQLRNEYQHLFDSCAITPSRYTEVDACLDRIIQGRPQYELVASRINIPWHFVGIIHNMECSSNFKTHLHNGDSLQARTKNVPAGYPKTGSPPFQWVDSAEDALRLKKLDSWTDWSIPGTLFQFERYNGFGYRPRGVNSPYLWSASNNYKKGKFTADGIFDGNAVSKQVGAAVLFRRMGEKQIAVSGESDPITQIKQLGVDVIFDPDHYQLKAEQLQQLLNRVGQTLRSDGKAGRNTSDAYQRISGKYLKGDSQK